MKRQWGAVVNRMSGGSGVGVVVWFGLLACLLILGCQTQGQAPSPGPNAAPKTQQAAPPAQPVAAPAQQQPAPQQEKPAVQAQQPAQPQPVATQPQPVATQPQQRKAEPRTAVATAAGPNDVTPSPKAPIPAVKGPRIAFEKTEFDMGEISTQSKSSAEFKWTNAGDSMLEITDVKKCCGANVKLEPQKLEPGASGVLTVEYSTGGEGGNFKKQLVVHSNDSGNPAVTLTILGKVVQRLVYKPIQLKLFLNRDNFGCGDLVLTATDGKPFSVKGYLCTGDCITVDFDPNVQATEFVLKPKVNKDKLLALTYSKGTLQIKLTRQDYDVVYLPFDLLPGYSVVPPQIIIFNVEPGKKETRKVTVLDNYVSEGQQADLTLDPVTSENQSVTVTSTEKIKDGLQLTVAINPPAPKVGERSFSDELRIKVKDGEEMKVNIRLFYAAKVLSNAGSTTAP